MRCYFNYQFHFLLVSYFLLFIVYLNFFFKYRVVEGRERRVFSWMKYSVDGSGKREKKIKLH